MSKIILFIVVMLGINASSYAQSNPSVSQRVSDWLVTPTLSIPLPAFAHQPGVRGQTFGSQDILRFEFADYHSWWPEHNQPFLWQQDQNLQWRKRTVSDRVISLTPPDTNRHAIAYLGTYLEVTRFQEVVFHVYSQHPLRIYVNGQGKTLKTSSQSNDESPERHAERITLETGTYFIKVKALFEPENSSNWTIEGVVEYSDAVRRDAALLRTENFRFVSLDDLSHQPQISSVAMSSDGSLVAISLTQQHPPNGRTERVTEIRSASNGEIVREYRGRHHISNLKWAPDGQRFAYTETHNGRTSVHITDLAKGSTKTILEHISHFGTYEWAPNGLFLVYSISEQPEANTDGVRLLRELPDRRPGQANRSYLYRVDIASGSRVRLTAGSETTNLQSISPDSRKILFSITRNDYNIRPYSVQQFNLLDLNDLSVDSLFTRPFLGSGQFSPDGKSLLLTGGPTAFGDVGTAVPEGTVANDYDTQMYLYNLESGKIRSLTKTFDPSVNSAGWTNQGTILLSATDQAFVRLFEYDLRRDRYTRIETDIEVIQNFSVARNAHAVAYFGTGINQTSRASAIQLRRNRITPLTVPGANWYSSVRFGTEKSFSFKNASGVPIDGHVYYPVNFNPDKKYPVIVYYYGGTVPVTRAFGGRYPKEFYAANGYLVYVLQPSGAIGYGQDFSALHVNDWGILVIDEIIAGTQAFLDAHPYADPDRLGAIGASFGGFMTMLLLSHTDMFAAGVSHAGISNITSYWGEGFWGYGYSAIATAYSFPWNRKDIYVGQSPIFRADKITTPLLLVTGMSDTNVPPGESIQMFTALKLLGRDVAFLVVDDQDHHIVDYNKYRIWKRNIMSWFDYHLKDQPEWWYHVHD